MREIGKNLSAAKEKVSKLIGVPIVIKFNCGRGKCLLLKGEITNVFPAVFTAKLDSGEIKTFSYADVHTKNILFLKPE